MLKACKILFKNCQSLKKNIARKLFSRSQYTNESVNCCIRQTSLADDNGTFQRDTMHNTDRLLQRKSLNFISPELRSKLTSMHAAWK